MDPFYYTASAISVGSLVGVLHPGSLAAVLATQATFTVIATLGYIIVRRRRSGRVA
jgi:hypothetical protein